jgi:hypothetical protein
MTRASGATSWPSEEIDTRGGPSQKCHADRKVMIEGSLEVKIPTIWRDEKQSREEAERRERLEERRVEEKE